MGITVNVTDNSEAFKAAMKAGVEAAMEAVGMQAERNVKLQAPVDTGRLRNSIAHTASGDTAYVGTNVEYAPYVEYGTYKMTAQPYLKPGVMEHIDEYKQIAQETISAHLP